jgi:hypothetical protein
MTWKLTGTGDLTITSASKLAMVTGSVEVQQRVIVALQHEYQEYFLNVEGGVPWYQSILGLKDLKIAETILRSIVMRVAGVNSILRLTAKYGDARQVEITALIETEVDGEIAIVPVSAEFGATNG